MSRKAKLSNLLLQKYVDQQCSDAENVLVEKWYDQLSTGQSIADEESDLQNDLDSIKNRLNKSIGRKKSLITIPRIVAAALVLIFLSVTLVIFQDRNKVGKQEAVRHIEKEKAYLILADGEPLSLESLKPGKSFTLSGIKVIKDLDGNVSYSLSDASSVAPIKIVTPSSGQYKFILPDGSLIHLNAGSIFEFKSDYGLSQRVVNLEGEAYFEVEKDLDKSGKRIPFIVYSQGQKIEVLGTHFNVRAYSDEGSNNISLIEGAIELTALQGKGEKIILKPGQQFKLDKMKGSISQINSEVVKSVDWVNGYFKFENESIEVIFAQIAKWYDVDVEIDPGVDKLAFGGRLSRREDLMKVIEVLEMTGEVKINVIKKEKRVTLIIKPNIK